MKLIDLHPVWVGAGGEGISDKDGNPVPERTGVGVSFDCPCGCDQPAFLSFSNPLDGGPPVDPKGNTWTREGDTFEVLTISPSIHRVGGCGWHGFITSGEVRHA